MFSTMLNALTTSLNRELDCWPHDWEVVTSHVFNHARYSEKLTESGTQLLASRYLICGLLFYRDLSLTTATVRWSLIYISWPIAVYLDSTVVLTSWVLSWIGFYSYTSILDTRICTLELLSAHLTNFSPCSRCLQWPCRELFAQCFDLRCGELRKVRSRMVVLHCIRSRGECIDALE